MSKIIDALEQEQMTKDVPEFAPGDTVVVQVKVKGRQPRAPAGLRGSRYCEAQSRPELLVHRAQDFTR